MMRPRRVELSKYNPRNPGIRYFNQQPIKSHVVTKLPKVCKKLHKLQNILLFLLVPDISRNRRLCYKIETN